MSIESSSSTTIRGLLAPKPRPIDRLLRPLQIFSRNTLAGASLLMIATVAAILWANSPWEHSYHALLELEIGVGLGSVHLSKSLHHWINDGLMGVFFFMVGLEIKRELLVGELSNLRKATLPAIAALGGMVVPASIYFALNPEGVGSAGWGIPMATDIAFALGILSLLGDRVPIGLKVFLTALAIVDDIGAVLVIAVFYTADLSLVGLAVGLICLVISITLNLLGARKPIVFFIVGTCAWLGFLESGVHATIAAILMAFTIPTKTRIDGAGFMARVDLLMDHLKTVGVPKDKAMNTSAQQRCFQEMAVTIELVSAPAQFLESFLSAPVTFVILPLFALANAGVTIHGGLGDALLSPIAVGIILGLFVGKTLGIAATCYAAVRLGIADLPAGVSWKQLIGVGMLGGIGFTMALFIGALAFSDPTAAEQAKVGILAASLLSAVIGFFVVRASASAPRARA